MDCVTHAFFVIIYFMSAVASLESEFLASNGTVQCDKLGFCYYEFT